MFTVIEAFFSKALAALMSLLISLVSLFGGYSSPAKDSPISQADPDNVKLTFAAWADPQVSNYLYKREPFLAAAGQDIANAECNIDALLIDGDIVENGLQCEYDIVTKDIGKLGVGAYLMASGNHEIRLRQYDSTVSAFTSFTNNLNGDIGNDFTIDSLHYSYDINGYRFIVMGTDKTEFEESYISEEQLKWLDAQTAEATEQGLPVFVLLHQPLKYTHGLPDTWNSPIDSAGSVGAQSDDVYNILNKYENVFLITGHLHTGFGQYSHETKGNVNLINLPSLGIGNKDGEYNEEGIGYMVEVYDDTVLFRARNFAKGIWLTDYDISVNV